MKKIDETLREQMESAADGQTIQAVFTLRSDDPARRTPAPDRTEALAAAALDRARQACGHDAGRVNVFRFMGSFAVEADANFLRTLLDQPEIDSAMANQRARAELARA